MYLVCLIQFVPNLFEHRIRLSSFNVHRYPVNTLWLKRRAGQVWCPTALQISACFERSFCFKLNVSITISCTAVSKS